MVRTREFDPATALSKAVELFSSKGYADTSMEDIVRATGVSRYGIYGTFGSKRELFEQALERFAENMGKRSFLRLLDPDASLASIERIFEERIADICCQSENAGCLILQTTTELASEDDEIREVLQKFMGRMSRTFAVGLKTAQEKGEVRADLDVRAAGNLLTSTMFGIAVLGRTGFDNNALRAIVRQSIEPMRA